VHGIIGYEDKAVALRRFTLNRQVLHLGAVGETMSSLEQKVLGIQTSVHASITRDASKCVGVDYDADAVEAIQRSGAFTNIICRDIFELKRDDIELDSIDCIVAGDVLEHMANPGLMLDVIGSICDPGTELVVTVPNSQGLPQFLRYVMTKPIEGADHKISFNVYSLRNLLQDRGWDVTDVLGCYQPTARSLNGSVRFRLGQFALRRVPSLAGTLLVVARKAG
jgi:Methyltransferase domain